MPFAKILRPLLLAPWAGVAVFVGVSLARRQPEALLVGLLTAPFCYAAEIAFVGPIMLFWPRSRTPSFVASTIWGTLAAWCSAAFVVPSILDLMRPAVLLGYGAAGAASGLFYAYLAKPPAAMETADKTTVAGGRGRAPAGAQGRQP